MSIVKILMFNIILSIYHELENNFFIDLDELDEELHLVNGFY